MSDNEQYPRGKLCADDEGQLAVAVTIRDKTVIVDFGKDVSWLGLDHASAVEFAKTILRRAKEIAPPEKWPDKPILCIDFDGVIHRYSNGWQGGVIYDDATDGFFEWAEKAAQFFTLTIYSSRSKDEDGRAAMMGWMFEQRRKWREKGGKHETEAPLSFGFADEKPAAFLTIDDRAVCFDGDWSKLEPEKLRAFKPWNVAS